MNNNTKMTEFKRNLSLFEGFSIQEQRDWTTLLDIHQTIKRLLDDELMMKPKNHYTFEQRTMMNITCLYRNVMYALLERDIDQYKHKLTVLARLLVDCTPHDIEITDIRG